MSSNEFPLLKLPVETRRNIYRFCIPHDLSVALSSSWWERNTYPDDPRPKSNAVPGLLLANRQINGEVEEMLYESNTFEISLLSENRGSFATQISLERIRKMRKLILKVEPYGLSYLKPTHHLDSSVWDVALHNLKYLGIVASQPVLDYPSTIFSMPDDDKEADDWKQYITRIFEYVAQTIAPTARIVVDADGEQLTVDCLQAIFSGRCSTEQLREGDGVFGRDGLYIGADDHHVYPEYHSYEDYSKGDSPWDSDFS